jgi:RNA polymerase sigma-70 factor, ECF subfamily
MTASSDWDWERYRTYLRCRARLLNLDRRLRVRCDESDLTNDAVQQAFSRQGQCRGTTEPERIAWLEQIQDNVLIDRWREARAGRRDIQREQEFRAVLAQSTVGWEHNLAASQASPSELASREELRFHVIRGIEQLPDDQREVVLEVLLLNHTLQEVADRLQKTKGAVAGLYRRGVERLRELLPHLRESSE